MRNRKTGFAWATLALALGMGLSEASPGIANTRSAEDSVEAINKAWQKQYQASRGKISEDDLTSLLDRAFTLASNDEDAKPEALMLVVALAGRSEADSAHEARNEAIELMIESYLDEPEIVKLVLGLGEADAAYLDQIAEETESEQTRACCAFAKIQPVVSESAYGEPLSTEQRKDFVAQLEKIIPSISEDLVGPFGRNVKTVVSGVLFELKNLQIGNSVPEISGVDIDGVEFKLSDYRGKVVMLDFWGHW